jgi:hypothetical protein
MALWLLLLILRLPDGSQKFSIMTPPNREMNDEQICHMAAEKQIEEMKGKLPEGSTVSHVCVPVPIDRVMKALPWET